MALTLTKTTTHSVDRHISPISLTHDFAKIGTKAARTRPIQRNLQPPAPAGSPLEPNDVFTSYAKEDGNYSVKVAQASACDFRILQLKDLSDADTPQISIEEPTAAQH